ncbi:serine/arginine repetitive matrix protein 4-like [Aethina tumida]|uniref:serine/arginine repetitive matrix protein 4-like n=1 Tax=Aethina tumida TaxID=116153 RepID=UPI002147EB97|nr:serine/arginine repetitive matrix protein 4-like [Aethina tumida]
MACKGKSIKFEPKTCQISVTAYVKESKTKKEPKAVCSRRDIVFNKVSQPNEKYEESYLKDYTSLIKSRSKRRRYSSSESSSSDSEDDSRYRKRRSRSEDRIPSGYYRPKKGEIRKIGARSRSRSDSRSDSRSRVRSRSRGREETTSSRDHHRKNEPDGRNFHHFGPNQIRPMYPPYQMYNGPMYPPPFYAIPCYRPFHPPPFRPNMYRPRHQ